MTNRGMRGAARRLPPATGITVYGCDADEAALVHTLAAHYGVKPTVTAAPVSEGNADLARGNCCISIGHKATVADPTLLALRRAGVEYISTRSIGCNHVNVACAESLGMRVETVSYSPHGVADYTLMLLLMLVRDAQSIVGRSRTHDYRLNPSPARELCDLTVGVIGTGRIGTAVMDRLRGFGCSVLAYDRRPSADAEYVSLDELLRRSDVVTLHTPLDASTHHLLNAERLEQMRPGASVINTSRGGLLDTRALIAALESGKLSGAALDVVEREEGFFYADCRDKPVTNELLLRLQELPSVLISPHTAYYTDRALRDAVRHSIINCLNFERRKRMPWAG